ncbi:hypothetical protein CCM_03737 [Cordyceps militaris CM01]|uniref:Uncharacterized protein n=1 Tax=Cordyceps militaris (strain CM01) TaxID=983644 RepID=G3JG86_CORMM|nr:uncharacterized protein CCM_03737 [Cordyceps militaris CM01]EGX92364.1 hypothetical protein CCM_03737 [Cordyceps militaris CM01]
MHLEMLQAGQRAPPHTVRCVGGEKETILRPVAKKNQHGPLIFCIAFDYTFLQTCQKSQEEQPGEANRQRRGPGAVTERLALMTLARPVGEPAPVVGHRAGAEKWRRAEDGSKCVFAGDAGNTSGMREIWVREILDNASSTQLWRKRENNRTMAMAASRIWPTSLVEMADATAGCERDLRTPGSHRPTGCGERGHGVRVRTG